MKLPARTIVFGGSLGRDDTPKNCVHLVSGADGMAFPGQVGFKCAALFLIVRRGGHG